jgi:hypothetical protein
LGQEREGADAEFACIGVRRKANAVALAVGKTHYPESLGIKSRLSIEPVALLFADAELRNNGLVPFRVVFLQVVEQAATPTHHHEESAARAVIFQVRFEMVRQLTDTFAQQSDLNFRTAGIGRVRAIRVNDGLLLLSG